MVEGSHGDQQGLKGDDWRRIHAQNTERKLGEVGFAISHWRDTERGDVGPGLRFGSKIIKKAKMITDENVRERILKEMKSIEEDGLEHGMREFPHYVVYARNSARRSLRKLEPLSLSELYRTVHHRNLLF